MDPIQHSYISARKFGGEMRDYIEVHKFLDSSKLYFHHVKHRAVLHNTYGVELAVEIFGDSILNRNEKSVCVRDIAIAHLKEDLSGHVPTLNEWFDGCDGLQNYSPLWKSSNEKLSEFINRPWLRSGLTFTKFITLSDFGVFLCERALGVDAAIELRESLEPRYMLRFPLNEFKFRYRWQYTVDQKELDWLRQSGL
jgi:hypothetical protein